MSGLRIALPGRFGDGEFGDLLLVVTGLSGLTEIAGGRGARCGLAGEEEDEDEDEIARWSSERESSASTSLPSLCFAPCRAPSGRFPFGSCVGPAAGCEADLDSMVVFAGAADYDGGPPIWQRNRDVFWVVCVVSCNFFFTGSLAQEEILTFCQSDMKSSQKGKVDTLV